MNLNSHETCLVKFLKEELAISDASVSLALRYSERDPAPLTMILWMYGLVSLAELDRILAWLENSSKLTV